MKLILRRAKAIWILLLLMAFGFILFFANYIQNASSWAQYPTNRHYYKNGRLAFTGKIVDRYGEVLVQTRDGDREFNKDKNVRTAVMHATGDANGNVATGAQVAFGDSLNGWDLLDGAYRFNKDSEKAENDLTLTIDAQLCKTAYSALNGRKGAVGVYNYKTGEILCMVSSPSFDPENPPDMEANPEQYEGVYMNRLLSAAYTPGSVFKLVTAAAAIDNLKDYKTKVYHCGGELEVNGNLVTCPAAHGDLTLEQALWHSCNVTFAQITLEIGAGTLQKYAEKAGFNSSLEVNGIKTAAGRVDVLGAEPQELAWAGIGQYSDTANPLSFMAYMGAIANDGVRISPVILRNGGKSDAISGLAGNGKRILSEETADVLGKMMRNAVINTYGEKNYGGLELCAKSGTAEVGGGKTPHAWFAGFLDRDDCPFAFVVVVENGGSGAKVAGPVAAKVLKAAVSRS